MENSMNALSGRRKIEVSEIMKIRFTSDAEKLLWEKRKKMSEV